MRGFIFSLFGMVILAIIGGSVLLFSYYRIARTLPSVGDLKNNASQFETTRILDRNGNSLYEILDPNAGRRTYVTIDRISPALIAATIATEDKDFYTHPGFDPASDHPCVVGKLSHQTGQGGGASTITQQLARALLLTPEERAQRTYSRKAREIILASEITRRYTKDEILELYLNEIYYGNLAYGMEAASETYFGKTANQLTSGRSVLPCRASAISLRIRYLHKPRYDTGSSATGLGADVWHESNQWLYQGQVRDSEVPICVDQAAALECGEMT